MWLLCTALSSCFLLPQRWKLLLLLVLPNAELSFENEFQKLQNIVFTLASNSNHGFLVLHDSLDVHNLFLDFSCTSALPWSSYLVASKFVAFSPSSPLAQLEWHERLLELTTNFVSPWSRLHYSATWTTFADAYPWLKHNWLIQMKYSFKMLCKM